MTNSKISPEEFIRIWNTSESLGEVAKAFEMKKASAATRANRYREAGIYMKTFNSLDLAKFREFSLTFKPGYSKMPPQ